MDANLAVQRQRRTGQHEPCCDENDESHNASNTEVALLKKSVPADPSDHNIALKLASHPYNVSWGR
jgi:hypothetical protein